MIMNLEVFKMTQEELFEYVKDKLDEEGVNYDVIKGNLISFKRKNEPALVAHADTIIDHHHDIRDYYKPLLLEKRGERYILMRENGPLGADDRAGVFLILNKLNYNFIITRDEEIGAEGAKLLIESNKFKKLTEEYNINAFLEFDRRGFWDIIGPYNNYCDYDLVKDIRFILRRYEPTVGVFTDCNYLRYIRPCVNLSVGFFNEHTEMEYLEIAHVFYLNRKIKQLIKYTRGKKYSMDYLKTHTVEEF